MEPVVGAISQLFHVLRAINFNLKTSGEMIDLHIDIP